MYIHIIAMSIVCACMAWLSTLQKHMQQATFVCTILASSP